MPFSSSRRQKSHMPILVQASLAKRHRLGGLKNKDLFSHSSGGWKVQDQGSRRAQFLVDLSSRLQIATSLLCPHMACPRCAGRRASSPLLSLLIRTLILLNQGPTPMTSFNLNYFLTPNTVTMGVRASTYEFGGKESEESISIQ